MGHAGVTVDGVELNKKKIGIIGLKSARERREREAADEEAEARANWRGPRWWEGGVFEASRASTP